ncbi:NAD(P)/FAD-dependent oxidoreductase [Ornithinimicrobium sp. INDO-MA30-4]|uniref:NAD(P)/FAD-dependent oxidoreductase n=1 Tax=Ornithinimicrobium sp. INDO-MA30-4 TaxID=2908651 RepID=UPI001F3A4BEC|nr:NAD(P)/FAD-dependent oxidoreductase [Ornithinimicrobium sp. INDO-MA30-4]UJH70245.1 FAD-dependent oxidoreductase [Ornithinimicrobium sp. INDO-MA30-4]
MTNVSAATTEHDVLVVGAGLAGLQCARTLQREGVNVAVWDAGDQVGGRIRTDLIDGFRLDRGFQVLNPAYPAIKEHIDINALGMQMFGSGVGVRSEDRFAMLVDPIREPALASELLRSGLLAPVDVIALARWAGPALAPPSWVKNARDAQRGESMDAVGLTGPLREVMEAFLAGVVLEDEGTTSMNFMRLLLRMFVFGSPGLPRLGMQALPQQIADELGDAVTTGVQVASIEQGRRRAIVHTADGRTASARLVVVATGATAAQSLVGVKAPEMKGVVADWFTMDEAPDMPPMLVVDGRGPKAGPVKNAAVISAAAPTYAPPGRHLVQASSLMHGGRSAATEQVLDHTGELFGVDTRGWQLIHRHEVPEALPSQPAPLRTRQAMRVSRSVIVAGDHMDTASIQGAMVSGERAAQGYLQHISHT